MTVTHFRLHTGDRVHSMNAELTVIGLFEYEKPFRIQALIRGE